MTTDDSTQPGLPRGPRTEPRAMPGGALSGPCLVRRHVLLGPALLWGALAAASRPASAIGGAAQAPLALAGRSCALVSIDLQVSNEHLPFQPHSFADVVRNANVVAAAVRSSSGLVARGIA